MIITDEVYDTWEKYQNWDEEILIARYTNSCKFLMDPKTKLHESKSKIIKVEDDLIIMSEILWERGYINSNKKINKFKNDIGWYILENIEFID